jgi:hypothetical protein
MLCLSATGNICYHSPGAGLTYMVECCIRNNAIMRDGGIVACRKCGGARQKVFNSELTLSDTDIKSVALAPVYVCNKLLVCLECGFAELTISEPDLDNLRKGPTSAP